MKELVKMDGSFFMCQLCMNLSAWNLKVFSMVSMSRRFSSGKALSVSFPYKVAKKIVLAMWFCFTWSFFRLLLKALPQATIAYEI